MENLFQNFKLVKPRNLDLKATIRNSEGNESTLERISTFENIIEDLQKDTPDLKRLSNVVDTLKDDEFIAWGEDYKLTKNTYYDLLNHHNSNYIDAIELFYENCEVIRIPFGYVKSMMMQNISEHLYKNEDTQSIKRYFRPENILLEFEYLDDDPSIYFSFDDIEESLLEFTSDKLLRRSDLVGLTLKQEKDEVFYVPFEGNNDSYNNKNFTSICLQNGNIVILISKDDQFKQDIFNKYQTYDFLESLK